MKNKLVLALLIFAACSAPAEEKRFVIDPVHSSVGFRIRHLYTLFPGRFNSFAGAITCDTNDIRTTQVRATVDVASIDTANGDRDKHLRGPDFFDVAKFAVAAFESTRVTAGPDNALTVQSNLTLHGVTAAMTFTGKILGYGADHKGDRRVGFHGEGALDRTAFGIAYNLKLTNGITILGNDVVLTLDLEAVETEAPPAEQSPARPAAEKKPAADTTGK